MTAAERGFFATFLAKILVLKGAARELWVIFGTM